MDYGRFFWNAVYIITLIVVVVINDDNFLIRMLYKDITFICAFSQWLYFILSLLLYT